MATLYDHRGQPVKTQALTREIARASIGGIRNVWYDSVATGLSPSSLATLLQDAADGDLEDYLTLAEEMEERDGHYYSTLQSRKLAITSLPFIVKAPTDEGRDVEIAEAVQELVDSSTVRSALIDILDGLGKSYSMTEIMWDRSGPRWTPRELIWRDPRFFRFDQDTGSEIRMFSEENMSDGVEIPPFKFIYHRPKLKSGLPLRGGLARQVAALHVFKSYALMDWMAFADIFGIPLRLGMYDDGASQDDIDTLKTAVAGVGSDAYAVIPESMKIEFIKATQGSGGSGAQVHEVLEDWLDKTISKVVLGQTMTTEDGSSLAQAKIHNEVRLDIRNGDAEQLENTLNRDLVRPFVDLNWGPQKKYPRLVIDVEEPEDLKLLAEALPPFIDRGLTVETSVIRDKFGLPEPEEGAEVLGAKAAPAPFGGGDEVDDQGDDEPAQQTMTHAAKNTTVQTVICSKDRFDSADAARSWVKAHDFKSTKTDETERSYRFRQREPGDFQPGSFRTISLTDGVSAVIGRLKASTNVHEETAVALMRQVERGETLTTDQREFLDRFLELNAAGRDQLDVMVSQALGDWRQITDPILEPILALAERSESFEDFESELPTLLGQLDTSEAARSLALSMYQARGMGDATDKR